MSMIYKYYRHKICCNIYNFTSHLRNITSLNVLLLIPICNIDVINGSSTFIDNHIRQYYNFYLNYQI